ncbi:MAG: hypothetical protein UT77_C0017G0011, partial [Candidatus Daviesbacteria bacterium GW2011_GWC2_40_12]
LSPAIRLSSPPAIPTPGGCRPAKAGLPLQPAVPSNTALPLPANILPVRMGQALPKPAATFPVCQVNPVINTALVPAAEIGCVIRAPAIPIPPAPVFPMTAGALPMLTPPGATATAVIPPPVSSPGFRFYGVMCIPIPALMLREDHNPKKVLDNTRLFHCMLR